MPCLSPALVKRTFRPIHTHKTQKCLVCSISQPDAGGLRRGTTKSQLLFDVPCSFAFKVSVADENLGLSLPRCQQCSWQHFNAIAKMARLSALARYGLMSLAQRPCRATQFKQKWVATARFSGPPEVVAGTLGIVLHCQVHLALSTKPPLPGCQAVKRRPSFQWWTPVLPHLARCAAQARQVGPQALLAAFCYLCGCLDWNWTFRVRRTAVTSRLQGLPHLGIFGLYMALGSMQTQCTGTGKSSPCRGDCWASNCAQVLLHLPAVALLEALRASGRQACWPLQLCLLAAAEAREQCWVWPPAALHRGKHEARIKTSPLHGFCKF